MSDIQDLKNHILALQQKLNDLVKISQNSSQNNDKTHEILKLIYDLGFERQQTNNVLFESLFPDIIKRLTEVERFSKKKGDHEYKPGDHFVVRFGKGKSKKRALMYVTEKGIQGFIDNEWVEFWEKR